MQKGNVRMRHDKNRRLTKRLFGVFLILSCLFVLASAALVTSAETDSLETDASYAE